MTGRPSGETSNPFATRFISPEAATYLFPAGLSAEALLARWEALGGRAALVGPHGVGKSTLLATLAGVLRGRGEIVVPWRLAAGRRTPPPAGLDGGPSPGDGPATLILDGYEQLSWWRRRTLRMQIRRLGWRALVTAHRRTAWPTLVALAPDPGVAVAAVGHLLRDHGGLAMTTADRREPSGPLVTAGDVRAAFARRRGDLRETLFDLYDLWERRSAAARTSGRRPG